MLVLRGAFTSVACDRAGEVPRTARGRRLDHGRDRSVDGKDGFHGAVVLYDAFLPLVANPAVLPTLVAACCHLAGAYASFSGPDAAMIHPAASHTADETHHRDAPEAARTRVDRGGSRQPPGETGW